MPVALLVHVPPVDASVSVTDDPAQIFNVPAIAAGKGFTVMMAEVMQPVVNVQVTLAVPAVVPVTIPVADPIEAIPTVPVLHEPPVVASERVAVAPAHKLMEPVIAAGNGLTVTISVTLHPVLRV